MIVSAVVKAECVVVRPVREWDRVCWWWVVVEIVVAPDRCWMLHWCTTDREPWQVCGGRLTSMAFLLVVVA